MSPHRDQRLKALFIAVAAVGIIGGAITLWPDPQPQPLSAPQPSHRPQADNDAQQHAREAREREVATRFQQGVAMLHAKQYEYAVQTLHRVLELSPRLVEAHVNMGYALLGLQQYQAAADFFNTAIELRPQQANAYYGLAITHKEMGDATFALGAMRTFIHLSRADDPYLPKARAAIQQWEQAQQEAGKDDAASGSTPSQQ